MGRHVDPRVPSDATVGAVSHPSWLDRIDRGLLEILQENGRASFRGIAKQLGVSEGAIRYRYGRLIAANVLQVVGITNPMGLGFDAMALIGIRTGTDGQVDSVSASAIADTISAWREASYVVITAGQFDIVVEVVCLDHDHLLTLIDRIRALRGVASAETFVYLRLCKQMYNWGTASDGETTPERHDREAAQ